MRTLFGENIYSPTPTSPTENVPRAPKGSEFILHSAIHSISSAGSNSVSVPASVSASASASASAPLSISHSPAQNEWLTQQLQHQRSNETDSYFHGFEAPALRRRGNTPSIAFMGLRRCGKSSIRKVVYEKLSPADTLYLEPTGKVEGGQMPGFINIYGCEIPSTLPVTSSSYDHVSLFNPIGAVVWVIDCQDEYFISVRQLLDLAVFLAEHYPRINLAVFVHKTDGLTDEYRYEAFREIRQRVQDELSDCGYGDRGVSYYQTSVFDHSIFEAMSKIVQKLLPQLPALEALLNRLCSTCRIQKAYLFDTQTKIYLATDASPTFLKDYEVCSEYVDMIVDIKQIYGWRASSGPRPDDGEGSIGESIVSYDRSGDTYMYVREINDFLSIVCILGQGSSADKRALIDYNASIMHGALVKIFEV